MSGKGATVFVSLLGRYEAAAAAVVFKLRECAAEEGSSIIGAGGATGCGVGMGMGTGTATGAGAGAGARAACKFSRSLSRTDFARICEELATISAKADGKYRVMLHAQFHSRSRSEQGDIGSARRSS